MTTIRIPGTNDADILTELKAIANVELRKWIEEVYETKVEGYLVNGASLAPFATPGDLALQTDTRTFFSYRNRLFSGIVRPKTEWKALQTAKTTLEEAKRTLEVAATTAARTAATAARTSAESDYTAAQETYTRASVSDPYFLTNIKQHMANGTTRRVVDNGDGDQPITNNKSWPTGDNEPFWGTSPFYERVPKSNILMEEQYYPLLKPYFQYVRLANKYDLANTTRKSDLFKQISALFFESARKVQPNGKLPKYTPQDSHPIPGLPNITRINKDKIKVYWAGCKHHSYWVQIGYEDAATKTVNWKAAKEITGTSVLVDAKGQKLHVALAFARYKPMTNNVAVPAPVNKDTSGTQNPDENSTGWSYRDFPLGPSTALPEHVVTTQLFDIDRFRLQLDKQYPDITVFDILEIVSDDTKFPKINKSSKLKEAMNELMNYLDTKIFDSVVVSDFVKWEHIDIPISKPPRTVSWGDYSYAQKVLIIHRSRIFDTRDQMKIFNIPSVVLDPNEYSRPAKYASVLGKRSNDPDFDVVDRAIQSARTNKFYENYNNNNILDKPWPQAKHHFKVYERGRGTFFAEFIYLNNRRETEACKRLRTTRRSLDLSRKIGVPVIPKKIVAPFPYVSNASSKRSTTFGVNNYDRMQSYPAVQELPRTFVPDEILGFTEKGASTASLLPIDKKLRSATFYNMRVNGGTIKELPHPGYPSRAKANAWQAIVNKQVGPISTFGAILEGAALINDKPIVLEL